MIQLCYHCPDCHTYLSRWFSAEDGIEQPEECLFCGSEQAFVYISDIEREPNVEIGVVDDVVNYVDMMFERSPTTYDMLFEDPTNFEE